MKQIEFTWNAITDADELNVMVDPSGGTTYSFTGSSANPDDTSISLTVPTHFRLGARYALQACNSAGCTLSNSVVIDDGIDAAIGYVKNDAPTFSQQFGYAVALSSNGSVLVVGAPGESGNAVGVNQPSNGQAVESGAAYVFEKQGTTWVQVAKLKASNTDEGDYFGSAVAVSADGNTIAVGASFEDGGDGQIGGDDSDDSAINAGAAYVFVRDGSTWTQEAYVKPNPVAELDRFGESVALSATGDFLAVGAIGESSFATGVTTDPGDATVGNAGAAYVFERTGTAWAQRAYLKAPNCGIGDSFGTSVAVDADGATVAVGAPQEDGFSNGVGGAFNDGTSNSGAAYTFTRNGTVWSFDEYFKGSPVGAEDKFGRSVSLDDSGQILAVGAWGATAQVMGGLFGAGAAYVFVDDGGWALDERIEAPNPEVSDFFGYQVALSADGSELVASAYGEDGGSSGITGDPSNNGLSSSGAGFVYRVDDIGGQWDFVRYLKGSNPGTNDYCAYIAISGNGSTIAMGCDYEDGSVAGVNTSDGSDNGAAESGAVYLY